MYQSDELLKQVNDFLEALPYERKPKSLYDPISYVLSIGGKRIRPVLMLLAYNLYKEQPQDIMMQAVALGAIEDIWALRRVVEASFPTETYAPETDGKAWDEAYAKYLEMFGNK